MAPSQEVDGHAGHRRTSFLKDAIGIITVDGMLAFRGKGPECRKRLLDWSLLQGVFLFCRRDQDSMY